MGLPLKMLLFACVGTTMEVVFTALADAAKTRSSRLMGYSYVWMPPIYALIPVFFSLLHPLLEGVILPLRVGVYTVILMSVELLSGLALRRLLGEAPWEPAYRGKRWALAGLVRLDFAPAWFLACLVFERLYVSL
ncbi:MAG: hypothetical protein HY924_11755 [Elusimicrobia bacterium]|nr:hypothetical protein [Elusimicrobiota bacterium]